MNIYAILQIGTGALLVLTILLQQRASGLSSALGGAGTSTVVKRRGAEKLIYQTSIVLSIVFFGLSIVRWFAY